ncbi:MAG: HAMP domain-containing histidine kinase [Trueperaceae bacterium]|nr:HAMP domain-containing histidine kinase [Trueperaceae bacterium]
MRLALLAAVLTLLATWLGLTLTYVGVLNLRISGLDDDNELLASLIAEAALAREDEPVRVPAGVSSFLVSERGSIAAHVYLDHELIWSGGTVGAPRPLDAERLLSGAGGFTARDWRVFTVRDEDAGIVVQVGRPLQGMRDVLSPYPEVALGVGLLVALVSGGLAWAVVGVALRPLRRLTAATERFDSADDVPDIRGRDEPARLAQAFSRLLTTIKVQREREHRFLAYAAHELRTPLSALRAGLEAVHAGRLEMTPDMVQRLHREAIRLESLAQNLLALSSAEAGDATLERTDLEQLAAEAYDRFLPLALEKGLALELDTAPAAVSGDVRLLDQALGNLMSNALRVTTSGRIVLRCGVVDQVAFVEVIDTGPGLARRVEGKGLGLRVVRAVAEAHGGGFELAASNGVTQARLWMPADA